MDFNCAAFLKMHFVAHHQPGVKRCISRCGEFEDALCNPLLKDTLHGAASLKMHFIIQPGVKRYISRCGEFEDANCSPLLKDAHHGAASLKMHFVIHHQPSVKRWILIVRQF